jgi:hypothetical protein
MAEILYAEDGGKLAFGDYHLKEKTKVEDFAFGADLLKVKTYADITRFEKNGLVVYESVPGTSVKGFIETADGVEFTVSGKGPVSITLGLQDDTLYEITEDDKQTGAVKTGLGGKLNLSIDLSGERAANVVVKKA